MNKLLVAVAVASAALITACSTVDRSIDIDQTSLDKASPFTPTAPQSFELTAGQFRETQPGAPAIIPHDISNYAVGNGKNACIMCHGDASRIGQPRVKGAPTTMPETHWTTIKGQKVMHPRRDLCIFCHAQQANVAPLVETLN